MLAATATGVRVGWRVTTLTGHRISLCNGCYTEGDYLDVVPVVTTRPEHVIECASTNEGYLEWCAGGQSVEAELSLEESLIGGRIRAVRELRRLLLNPEGA